MQSLRNPEEEEEEMEGEPQSWHDGASLLKKDFIHIQGSKKKISLFNLK